MLYAATSAPDTDWIVKLCEVAADGRTLNFCDGILSARFRDREWTTPSPVEPEAPLRYEIDLWATSIVLAPGHRIRVVVTSSDFPRYDRNPNTGELGVAATMFRPRASVSSPTPSARRIWSCPSSEAPDPWRSTR